MRPPSQRQIESPARFSTLQCGSWIDACLPVAGFRCRQTVSVPFNAGRGLMQPTDRAICPTIGSFSTLQCGSWIDAHFVVRPISPRSGFSTLQCGSWIDASRTQRARSNGFAVSVPFNAGRGLMLRFQRGAGACRLRFSTLQCGSWIDAYSLP